MLATGRVAWSADSWAENLGAPKADKLAGATV